MRLRSNPVYERVVRFHPHGRARMRVEGIIRASERARSERVIRLREHTDACATSMSLCASMCQLHALERETWHASDDELPAQPIAILCDRFVQPHRFHEAQPHKGKSDLIVLRVQTHLHNMPGIPSVRRWVVWELVVGSVLAMRLHPFGESTPLSLIQDQLLGAPTQLLGAPAQLLATPYELLAPPTPRAYNEEDAVVTG
jgi:hypothetical protein